MEIRYISVTGFDVIPYIGKFAMDKKVISELTYPITTTDKNKWFIAIDKEDVVGFCSAILKKDYISFNHAYVLPEYRNKGIYTQLFSNRLNDSKGLLKSVCTDMSKNIFIKNKFIVTKVTKNYTFVELNHII
jgi:predicted GNAT family acetyltransferase